MSIYYNVLITIYIYIVYVVLTIALQNDIVLSDEE